MLLAVKWAGKILAALNSEVSPKQIAAGFALGVWIGLLPAGLLSFALLLLAFVVNVNLALLLATAAILKIVGIIFDPLANLVGYALLVNASFLEGLWTSLYNTPIIPYTKFNNTVVLGSFVIGFLLLVPMYFLGQWGVVAYRQRWRERIVKMKVVQVFKASMLYRFYSMYRGIRGE